MTEIDRKIVRKLWRWKPGSSDPRPEWHWYSHDELQEILAKKLRTGEITRFQIQEAEDDEETGALNDD